MKKITLTLTAVLVGLLLTTSAFAWGPGSGKGRGYGPCGNASLEGLNLTDEQKVKIEALQDAHYKAMRPVRKRCLTNPWNCEDCGCRPIRTREKSLRHKRS
jgi:Spy/CpxP family protein refolding chaperone